MTTLNKRVNIEQPAVTQDEMGQPATDWALVAAVWADIRNLGGLESIKAGADVSILKASIRIRYRAGINAGMRVVYGAATYDIKAVSPDSRKQFMDLVCEAAQ